MKYLKYFREAVVNLNDLKFGERDAVGNYRIPSYGKYMYFNHNNCTISSIKYYVFTEVPYTKEFRGQYNTEIYIDYIETDEDYKRNGIAGELIKRLINKGKEMDIDVITLKYDMFIKDPDNLKRYYEKFGFKLLNGNKMYLPLKKPL